MEVLVWDPAIAQPKDLQDALQLIEQLRALQEKPNPKFLQLAHALLRDPAFAGQWGAERMLDDARNCSSAIWEPRIPAGDGMPAMRAVIRHATSLGLIAYRASRQAVFLPGDGTVTPERKALSDGDFEDYDVRLRKRVEVCETLFEQFTKQLAPLGFHPSHLDATEVRRFAGLSFSDSHVGEFSRPMPDGWQRLIVTVNDADADSDYFKCSVMAGVRHETIEAIFTRVFGDGISRPETFFFDTWLFHASPGSRGFPLIDAAQAIELPGLIARLAMPVLELARTLAGIDAAMNDSSRFPIAYRPHPLSPPSLADLIVSFGRQSCLKTLIASWLTRSPNFENRVAVLREFVKKRVDVGEADLDRLLVHLRTTP